MTTCDGCGKDIQKGDNCGNLTSGYAKGTVADEYGPDSADIGAPEDIANFEPNGDEYFLCDECVVRCIKLLQPTGGHSA